MKTGKVTFEIVSENEDGKVKRWQLGFMLNDLVETRVPIDMLKNFKFSCTKSFDLHTKEIIEHALS